MIVESDQQYPTPGNCYEISLAWGYITTLVPPHMYLYMCVCTRPYLCPSCWLLTVYLVCVFGMTSRAA